ncbi:acyl-CoA N-acyltransferase [Laetiporus sulphureus 93-53]|uniref:Acyl-CoA N-acyltransferase n=1 Tax=Laetiporus sulphureus 93-53 TaxID=1314785 RepID=A0A165CWT5_9APHY|nr:acyl-CoA N-acyltransferase [Laetiporus sulphureus 93-53]KZT03612.1 acyl-CoA N-acyltransferase [Laetiporus sulphureus 93-53]
MIPIFYDLVSASEVPRAHEIETAGYPADEAASLEAFRYRQANAPDLFLGAYLLDESGTGRTLVGYVCSTLSPDGSLSHDSMSKHVLGASSACIHSVCVAPEHRRKGVALGLLKEYLTRLENAVGEGSPYQRVLLITHEDLRGLYEKAGFEWLGRSAVVHGARPWFEMRRILSPSLSSVDLVQPPTIPAGLWEALQQSTNSRSRPIGLALTAFPNGVQDVVTDNGQGTLANNSDLLCPRAGCGSIILKKGVASLVERASVQLESPESAAHSPLASLPPPPETMNWWLVRPNAMAFENVGFSKAVVDEACPAADSAAASGKRLKLLSCADCDIGPLGWCEDGGSEFWLACSRVTYRQ